MPFSPNSSSCPKKLSSEYQLYACGNFFGHSSILEKIAILGQPPGGSVQPAKQQNSETISKGPLLPNLCVRLKF